MKHNYTDLRIDTYSPKELEKFVASSGLIGKTIDSVIFNKGVADVLEGALELWEAITFKFSDNSKTLFEFWSSSHVKITIYDSNIELEDSKDYYGEIKQAHVFFEPVIGQKITNIEVESAEECDYYSVGDAGFDETQDSFIIGIRITLGNGKVVSISDGDDFMYVAIK